SSSLAPGFGCGATLPSGTVSILNSGLGCGGSSGRAAGSSPLRGGAPFGCSSLEEAGAEGGGKGGCAGGTGCGGRTAEGASGISCCCFWFDDPPACEPWAANRCTESRMAPARTAKPRYLKLAIGDTRRFGLPARK